MQGVINDGARCAPIQARVLLDIFGSKSILHTLRAIMTTRSSPTPNDSSSRETHRRAHAKQQKTQNLGYQAGSGLENPCSQHFGNPKGLKTLCQPPLAI